MYYYLSDYEKAAIDEKIVTAGFFCIRDTAEQNKEMKSSSLDLPLMIVRDDTTGFYFDSFTDRPFIFLPSQMDSVMHAGSAVDKTYV